MFILFFLCKDNVYICFLQVFIQKIVFFLKIILFSNDFVIFFCFITKFQINKTLLQLIVFQLVTYLYFKYNLFLHPFLFCKTHPKRDT